MKIFSIFHKIYCIVCTITHLKLQSISQQIKKLNKTTIVAILSVDDEGDGSVLVQCPRMPSSSWGVAAQQGRRISYRRLLTAPSVQLPGSSISWDGSDRQLQEVPYRRMGVTNNSSQLLVSRLHVF